MIERGKYVAIMPSQSSLAADVLEIESVIFWNSERSNTSG